jgi:CubicO group peptidase (beta-lactamase class C family)
MIFRRWRVIGLLCAFAMIAAASSARNGDDELQRKVDQVFAAYDKPDSPGCALGVVRDGNFIYKRGYGQGSLELGVPLTPESVFYMGSVSKQFTAASVVLAAEQGYLSLDDDIRKYISELPSYGTPITLREMLHHTSGLRDVLTLMFLSGRNAEDIHPVDEYLDLIVRQKVLNFTPGDEYLYSNTNYFLMGVVIRRTTGKTLAQFAEENIFKPLGMTHTRFYDDRSVVVPGRVAAYSPRPDGGFKVDWSTNYDQVGGGGLMSSVDDLLLWDRNFYANKLGKGSLLPELQTPGTLNNGKPIEYALGLFMSRHRGLPIVAHDGALFGYRTTLVRFPEQKFSAICVCNLSTANPLELAFRVSDIYLADKLASDTADAGAAAKVDPHPFAGAYRSAESHAAIELKASDTDLEAFGAHFKPRDATHFVSGSESEMAFEHGPAGMRLTLSVPDASPRVFETYQAVKPSNEDLGQFAGEYRSEELQATYRFGVKDGRLNLTVTWQQPQVLEATVRDEFQSGQGVAFVFRRDAGGRVTGFDLFAGRVRNISFARMTN